jgi:hypothetical protein
MSAGPLYTSATTNRPTWSAVAGATHYYLEWSTSSLFTRVAGNSGWTTATAWLVAGLSDGRTYYYRVKSRNAAQLQSAWSNVAASTPDASPPQSRVLALPAYETSPTFKIAWAGSDAVSGLASVRLFYRRAGSGLFAQYGGTHAASPISFDSSQTGGDGGYEFYTVGADKVGNQEGVPSAPDAWTTVSTTALAAPVMNAGPLYTSTTTNRPIWSAVAGATHYYLEWSTSSLFTQVAGNSGWTTATTRLVTSLSDGQTYYYRVKSRDAALLQSAWSNVAASTPDLLPPETSIGALPTTTTAATIALRISGADAVSGLRCSDLYWRRGQTGAFQWLAQWSDLPQTCLFNTSEHGGPGFYQFMVRGTDCVGNIESKSQPDAQTRVDWSKTATRHWTLYGPQ